MNDEIHIGIACNDAYACPAGVLLSSIIHHTGRRICFHLFTCGISNENLALLRRIVSLSSTAQLDVVRGIEVGHAGKKHAIEYLSDETWCRLMAPALLPGIDKLLWLDIDLLVRGDVARIYDIDISDHMAAGVEEEQMRTNGYPESIGMDASKGYVNAGVLLLNLRLLRDSGMGGKLIEGIKSANGRFMDQDVLNCVLQGRIALLPRCFNFNLYYYRVYKRERGKALIIHFTGPEKPWHLKGRRRWCNRLWRMSAVRMRFALFTRTNNRLLNGLVARSWFFAASIVDSLSKTFKCKTGLK